MKTRVRLWAWVGLGGAVGVAIACVGEMEGTVHFNASVPDFGAPPPAMAVSAWGEHPNRPVPTSYDVDPAWNETDAHRRLRAAKANNLRAQATMLEKAGEWAEAAGAYERSLSLDPQRAEWARDRAEVLRQYAKAGASVNLRPYFEARDLILRKRSREAQRLLATMDESSEAGFLRPHVLYAQASILYDLGEYREAAALYEQVAAAKNSPRREPALIMAARCLLMPPLAGEGDWNAPPFADEPEVRRARWHLRTLLTEYPRSRFRWSARGWLGRCDYVSGQRPQALRAYLMQLETARTPMETLTAMSSIRFTLESLNAGDASRVNEMLHAQPELLGPYLAYRIHHTDARPQDLQGLAALARDVLARRPGTKIAAGVRARLAEIQYLTVDPRAALQSALASLSDGGGGAADLAMYVKGASLARLGRQEEARAAFAGLVAAHPKSYLSKPARENLALQYERLGDFGRALDTYRALGYKYDVAYLVDIRMSPEQIAAYLANRPNDAQRSLWRYSLGLRYLRDGNLEAAESTLQAMPNAERRRLAKPGSRDYAWFNSGSKFDKLYDPLTTARDLQRLRALVVAGKSRAEKADATYALASYYYERRNLLLYNAPLWEGARESAMGSWNSAVATREDTRSLDRHAHEHESIARAREICLRLAAAYPDTPAAPKALYRAATATRRLADFNSYWRGKDPQGKVYAEAAGLLARVYKEYPRSPLAKNARKYERVFRQEGNQTQRQGMFALETNRG